MCCKLFYTLNTMLYIYLTLHYNIVPVKAAEEG